MSFWLLSLFVIWLFLMMTVGPGLFEPGFILAVGWIQFLARTLPRIAWSWDLIGMGAICVGAILLLGHSFAKWITNKLASARGVDWFWPWKWTWLGICAVMIFFLVGMAAGGIAHQIGWLISSPGPWYEEKGRRGRDFMSMRQLQLGFQEVLKDEDGNIEKVRLEFWKPHNDYVYQMNSWPPIMQEFHFLVVVTDDGKVAGTIIFPRDAGRRAVVGGCYSFGEKNCEPVSPSKLPELIRNQQAHLIAL